MKKKSDSADGLPAGLAAPAVRALHGAGVTKLDQLTRVTESELMKLHGMGPKAMETLRQALKARNLSFKNSP